MLPANHTDRPHIAFDDHRFIVYALDLPQTRPRLSWPRCHSRPREHRQQDDDLLTPALGDCGCINDTASSLDRLPTSSLPARPASGAAACPAPVWSRWR